VTGSNSAFPCESNDERTMHTHRRQIDLNARLSSKLLVSPLDGGITLRLSCVGTDVGVLDGEDDGAERVCDPVRE
jgi:hypothetical protein